MKLRARPLSLLGLLLAVAFAQAAMGDDTLSSVATNAVPSASQDSRFGLFNGLDHRSFYNQGDFPEPFLVDDSGLEVNEARLDWLRTKAGADTSDMVKAEVEKGFGLLTVEIEVPYMVETEDGQTTHGFDNLDLGARYPLFQYVSAHGFFDTTFGAAVEVGIPVDSTISRNTEFVPKLFNDTRIGKHFTSQAILGYSTLFGPGEEGGLQTFEYGFVFAYTLQHRELPIPGVMQFIPMMEIIGGTELNNDNPGQNSVTGDVAFRVNLNPIGRVQPRLGLAYVFPMNSIAREDTTQGFMVSLVFEY